MGVTCQVRLLGNVLLYAVRVFFKFSIDTSRHPDGCADKCKEHVRAANCTVQRTGSKSRSSLLRAEMIYYVTLSPRGS